MSRVLLFNPRAVAKRSPNYRIPNSILQIAASIQGKYDYVIVDGNREKDSWKTIESHLKNGSFRYFASTVMPGPQLKEAIPITKSVRLNHPEITNIWGGYFASNQSKVVLESGYVDYCINGPGDIAFPKLLNSLEHNQPYELIPNIVYLDPEGTIRKTLKEGLLDQDELPSLPYPALDQFYSIKGYLKKTHLGSKTLAYHSSIGCPFTCSFCAVVPIYEAKWKGKSAKNIYQDIMYLKENYGADSIEFHDNNFFVSEKRSTEFARLIRNENMHWWGEGRIDTVDKYSDASLDLLASSGCKMIFFGAESGNDTLLKKMDKGGKQSSTQIKHFAARLKKFGIVPEYSFVLGLPAKNANEAMRQVDEEISFIKEIKEINPFTEIIIYIYSPVPTEGSELYNTIHRAGFSFPKKLEDWLSPAWENFDLRKNPMTPWLTPGIVRKIQNFETVINAHYPTGTDIKLSKFQRKVMHIISGLRYRLNYFDHPLELKFLQKFWLHYRQPEWEGF